MDPKRPDRILEEWDAVAATARQPDAPPRRVVVRAGPALPGVLGRRPHPDRGPRAGRRVAGSPRSERSGSATSRRRHRARSRRPRSTPSATAAPTATRRPDADRDARPDRAPTPTPSAVTDRGAVRAGLPRGPDHAAGRARRATGSRPSSSRIPARSCAPCSRMSRPQLVDGKGSVLIDGSNPPASWRLRLGPGDRLTTLVDVANYCGPTPVRRSAWRFVLGGGAGRIVATAAVTDRRSDAAAVQRPCGRVARRTISMQPWPTDAMSSAAGGRPTLPWSGRTPGGTERRRERPGGG